MFEMRDSKVYTWFPKIDITAFELAKCIPMFNINEEKHDEFYNKLPKCCKRHFLVKE